MKQKFFTFSLCLAWILSSQLTPTLQAATAIGGLSDIALQKDGVLLGKLVDAQGRPVAKCNVKASNADKEIGSTISDNSGSFQLTGLRGGVVEIQANNTRVLCRVWAPQTAPPQAQTGLLVVANSDVVCGQNCGNCVGCGDGVCSGCGSCGGHGGGILGIMADRPLVAAGVVGAAIAIPIAVSNNSSPSTP